jgi:hypothetical protein
VTLRLATLDEALAAVRGVEPRLHDQSGPAARALLHCVQSIELSLEGYPTLRSPFFRATAGRAAFWHFKRRGYLRHDCNASIPGAAQLPAVPLAEAIARFDAAVQRFHAFSGELAPHFAYGALSKRDMEIAHAMHVGDHLEAVAG